MKKKKNRLDIFYSINNSSNKHSKRLTHAYEYTSIIAICLCMNLAGANSLIDEEYNSDSTRNKKLQNLWLDSGDLALLSNTNTQDIFTKNNDKDTNTTSADTLALNDDADNEKNNSTDSDTSNTTKTKSSKNNPVKLNTVVTTATGFSKDVKDAPASVTVIPQEEILARPIKDLGDAVQDVPGVYVESTKTGQNQIYMRGLSSSYTLILIDGKRQNVNGAFDANGFNGAHSSFMPPVSMIERIEVIRGPASIIYGADALGGVINIITKKNPKKFTGSVMLETTLQEQRENWGDNYGANTYVASPVWKDKLFMDFRAAYKYSQASYFYKPDGISTNPYTTHSPGRWYTYNLGGRLSYIIDPENVVYLDGEFYHTTNTTLNTSSQQISATNDFNKANISLSHDGEYNWGQLRSYLQYTLTQRIPQTTTGVGNVSGELNYASLRQNDTVVLNSMYNDDFSFGKWGDLGVTAGANYQYEKLFIRANSFDRDSHQFAVFVEGQYFILSNLSTTLGLRYNYANLYEAVPTPRFYVNYSPLKFLTIKAGVANGYLIPNLNQSYNGLYNISTANVYSYGYSGLQAEKSWNYELGVIFETNPVYINITGFYTDFTDQIQQVTGVSSGTSLPGGYTCPADVVSCSYYDNVDKSLATGIETSLQTKPFYGVSFDFGYSFTYTEQLSGSQKGEPVNSVPRHKLTAKISYKWREFSTYFRFQGNFQTPTLTTSRGGVSARNILGKYYKDYVLLDWAASYKFLKYYTLTFSINNLLNTNFIDYIVSNTSYINAYQRFLPGRNYWISFKADW